LGMAFEVAVVAVDGHEKFRADEVDHHPKLFLRAVAGNVDEAVGSVVMDDARIAAFEVVDDAVDGFLVARNDARAEDNGVAGVDFGELVVVDGSTRERAHRLTLRTGDQDAELIVGVLLDLAGMDEESRGRIEVAEVLRDLSGVVDRAPDERDLAVVLIGKLHRDADAVDRRREAGEEELLTRGTEDVVETRADGALAGREAGPVDVGGVLQEAEDILLAEVGKGLQVERMAVRRGEVDLEVAGVEDDAGGGVDGERDAVDERVRDADGHDAEGAERETPAGQHLDELSVVEEAVLVELALDIGEG